MSRAALESVLAAGFLLAMDAFAHLKLTAAGFAACVAGWIVTAGLRAGLPWFRPGSAAGRHAGALLLPALWLVVVNPQLKQALSAGQVVYAVLMVALVWTGMEWLLAWCARQGAGVAGEGWRWLLVGGGGAVLTAPFFSDLQFGGTDARWYTSVFIDFATQLRAGVFPVFVGQGELSFNGSVNLFRSAPLCLWIGGAWDFLTWQSLSPVAIRNLSIVTSAVMAAFGMYAVLVRLLAAAGTAPAWHRWLAALGALAYVLCPGVWVALYFYELQMTFTAMIALPWIFYGNLRSLTEKEGAGHTELAIGLALAWYAHAPLAILSSGGTVILQVLRYLFEPAALVQWKAALRGAGLFALLVAYYFAGMSELPPLGGSQVMRSGLTVLGVGLVVAGTVVLAVHRRWWAGLGLLAGGGLLAWLGSVWIAWAVIWVPLCVLVVLGARAWRPGVTSGGLAWLAFLTVLGAGALAWPWAVAHPQYVPNYGMTNALREYTGLRAALVRPLVLGQYSNCQPGYTLWVLAALFVVAAPWLRSAGLALLAALVAFLAATILHLPWVTDFLVTHAPAELGEVVNFPMLYRVVPLMAALILVGGLAALGRLLAGWQRGWWLVAAMLAGGVLWNAWEARAMIRELKGYLNTRGATERAFSPDNYTLGRYPYLMLRMTPRFIDGKQTHWLESRLLDGKLDVTVGPEQLAAQAEAKRHETLVLTSRVSSPGSNWLEIEPDWEIHPGEALLLRFEFPKDMNAAGWLILHSPGGYQELLLEPGAVGTGFGTGRFSSPVTAVTNRGDHTERYHLQIVMTPANTLPRDGQPWGKLHLSRYLPEEAPIQVRSLIPYRARVTAKADGYLETPRQWLAGYRARVDGRPVELTQSRDSLVAVPVGAGTHEVELEYVGSARLWAGLVVTGFTVVGLLWLAVGNLFPGWREAAGHLYLSWREQNRS